MTAPQSPSRFNGYEDDILYPDATNFTYDISDKMRVPKRIRGTGEFSDDDHLLSNQNGIMNSWNYNDKIDMNVPDRIVVIGQEQILGTRSAPREIMLENSILPKDPGFVRVATPPRVITLSEHHFPTAADERSPGDQSESPPYYRASIPATIGFNPAQEAPPAEGESDRRVAQFNTRKSLNYGDTSIASVGREGTPPLSELTTPNDEILYLRRQMAKLNRRVLTIEIENVQRQQREKIIYCLGLAYFFLKAIFWLNRN